MIESLLDELVINENKEEGKSTHSRKKCIRSLGNQMMQFEVFISSGYYNEY